ncbi:MAG: hypothetical protein JKY37_09835 [Nannocystaceae bacterium]|nr:hypothetical protein [Nannocystaceae bacterium]
MNDDPELDALLGDVTQTIEDDLEANVGVPDLLAVVERAHRMDASVVPQDAVDEVSTYASVISLGQARRLRQSRNDEAFDGIVREVRGHVDQDIARALGTAPRAESPQQTEAPWYRKWAVVSVAAVALLSIGVGIGVLQSTLLSESPADQPNAVLHSPRPDDEETARFKRGDSVNRERPAVSPETRTSQEPTQEPSPEADTTPAPKQPDQVLGKKSRKKSRDNRQRTALNETHAQKLDRLEREANGAWKSGRHADAASTYRKIIKLDRRGSWAQSAYGELFTLQRQRGKSVVALWRSYLARFPKGRFADDASAGLCRRASATEKVTCWTKYLDSIQEGSFRQQARREIEQHTAEGTP